MKKIRITEKCNMTDEAPENIWGAKTWYDWCFEEVKRIGGSADVENNETQSWITRESQEVASSMVKIELERAMNGKPLIQEEPKNSRMTEDERDLGSHPHY